LTAYGQWPRRSLAPWQPRLRWTPSGRAQGAPQHGQGRSPHGQPQFGHAAIAITSLAGKRLRITSPRPSPPCRLPPGPGRAAGSSRPAVPQGGQARRRPRPAAGAAAPRCGRRGTGPDPRPAEGGRAVRAARRRRARRWKVKFQILRSGPVLLPARRAQRQDALPLRALLEQGGLPQRHRHHPGRRRQRPVEDLT
jgi:hypothetical protein